MSAQKPKQPVAGGVFTDEDYWFLGKTMALSYQHALRRQAAADDSREPSDEDKDRVRVQRDCSPALPWIERPTRAGWWWMAEHNGEHWEVRPRYVLENFLDIVAVQVWRWWAGPIESPDAPTEEPRENKQITD